MNYAPINVSPLPRPSGLYGGFDIPEGSATDRIWDKQRFQILRFLNLKSQSFQKVVNLRKFQEIDPIIEQIL